MPRLTRARMTARFTGPGRAGTTVSLGLTGGLAAAALVLTGLAAVTPAQAFPSQSARSQSTQSESTQAQSTQAQPTGRVPIAGTRPSWAVVANRTGRAPLTVGTVQARVYLAPRDPAGLAAVARAVSAPGNARYRHRSGRGSGSPRSGSACSPGGCGSRGCTW